MRHAFGAWFAGMSLLAVLLLLAGLSWHDQQVAARYDDPFLSWERSTAAAETWRDRRDWEAAAEARFTAVAATGTEPASWATAAEARAAVVAARATAAAAKVTAAVARATAGAATATAAAARATAVDNLKQQATVRCMAPSKRARAYPPTNVVPRMHRCCMTSPPPSATATATSSSPPLHRRSTRSWRRPCSRCPRSPLCSRRPRLHQLKHMPADAGLSLISSGSFPPLCHRVLR